MEYKKLNLKDFEESYWIKSKDVNVSLEGKHVINFDKKLPLIIKPIHFYIDYTLAQNYHDYLEIAYIINGKGVFVIGNKKYSANKGDIFIINNVELHTVSADHKKILNVLPVYFLPEIIYKPGESEMNLSYLNIFYCQSNTYSHKIPSKYVPSEIPDLIYKIYAELTNKKYYYALAAKTYLQQLLIQLLYYFKNKLSDSRTAYERNFKNIERLKEIFLLLMNQYNQNISLKQASKIAHMSTPYFCKFFKKVTGSTFNEYLVNIRIDKAKELLLKNNSTITDIAFQVGFNNLGYFYRVFKKNTKLKPSEFRSIIRSM